MRTGSNSKVTTMTSYKEFSAERQHISCSVQINKRECFRGERDERRGKPVARILVDQNHQSLRTLQALRLAGRPAVLRDIGRSACPPDLRRDAGMIADRNFALVPYDKREAITVDKAAAIAGRSASTVRGWCERYPIARRVAGGNWQISRIALQMLLDGDLEALRAYGAGDRNSPGVSAYFKQLGLGDPAARTGPLNNPHVANHALHSSEAS